MSTQQLNTYDVIIIGGGAAGLMCAATAAQRGKNCLIIDHSNKFGKKILMSGGGRCNFTNLEIEPENYLSPNPHFCKSALSRFTQWDFIAMVSRYDIAYHEKTLGQLFCDNKASDILNMLLQECERHNVTTKTHCTVETVHKNDNGYQLTTSQGPLASASLVIATGGLSIPTMGATGFGYDIAKQFDISVSKREAALVPLTLSGRMLEQTKALAGVALDCCVSTATQSFNESMLFTHRGLSGPAILQISNYWQLGKPITIDFLPCLTVRELITQWRDEKSKQSLKNLLAQHLPKRFISAWIHDDIADKTTNQLEEKQISEIENNIHSWTVTPSGTEGYRTAEVTRGGVNTDEISSKSFEAKNIEGLYFIGEVLDVTGWLGGYNFQWAWASGYCAGLHV
ncbi:MAG: putative Rossmann fold flavoprotein [Flavobacteriales bacterium]|jgi:predicted Rossmann fold flavoprotein